MWIHFDNRAAAEADLAAHGFCLCKTGRWVKESLRATILKAHGDVVVVCYEEVAQ